MCRGQGPGELPVEGSLKGVNSTCLSSAQNSSGAPTALRIETSAQWPASLCALSPADHPTSCHCLSLRPFLFSSQLASFALLPHVMASTTPGPLHTQFPLPEIILPCSASFTTQSSLQSQFRSHFPRKAFPGRHPPLLRLSLLLNRRLWVVYLEHIFLPEPGRKRDCAVLHPQEERALPWGPRRLAGLCSLGPSDLRPITTGPHLIGL